MRSEPGASPQDGYIPLAVPEIRGNEWKYLKECLDTNWVSSAGPFVDRFESMLSGYVGAQHGVAMSSGTAALHIALLAAGVQPDDEVLVSTLTFIAPANAVRYAGAWPVFIDAEPDHWQMDADKLANFVTNQCRFEGNILTNKHSNRRISAVIPVHILGHPCDMAPVLELAGRYNLTVIEDATESLGATYQGKSVGHLGDIGCFSFNGNKLITTGGGGMLVTDNAQWAQRARYLTTQAKDDAVEYVHDEIGYNYRLTNLQAAMGCAQMELLDEYVAAKRKIAHTYNQVLGEVPGITLMEQASWAESACWLYTVAINETQYGMGSRDLLKELESAGIQSRPLWQPLHLSPAHQNADAQDCPVAQQLGEQCLSLPCSVGLTREEQAKVIGKIVDSQSEAGQ